MKSGKPYQALLAVILKNIFSYFHCLLFNHRLRFVRKASEGGKIYRCERCGVVLWKTPESWYDLGRDKDA
ncbi:MAG: hypothetical protein H6974_11105 [Gammaproteobacteria bacterium]|nr:hypothetical protein [Gammaproteobacteria bacterium]